jgi:hypothetical protein
MFGYSINEGNFTTEQNDTKEHLHCCCLTQAVMQPCPKRRPRAPWRPRYTFLAPSVSTLVEPIININSNFKTKTFLNV